jgi:hypothetical protein
MSANLFQPVNNVPLLQQEGGNFVLKENVDIGGDALIGFSASAWSSQPGPISMTLWLDEQPTDGVLTLYADAGEMHLALGHAWVWCQGVEPGQHEIMLEAGDTTRTDANDYACVTVWEMGGVCAVRLSESAPCPSGIAQPLITRQVEVGGGQLLVSGSASGSTAQAGTMIAAFMTLDGGNPLGMEVFCNNAGQHLAMVPCDMVTTFVGRGDHEFQLAADENTTTDDNDTAHLTVVEWLEEEGAPVFQETAPELDSTAAATQSGGGENIASAQFESNGGTLLIRTGLSCWTSSSGGVPLSVGIQVDGTSVGFAQIWANVASTHMATVTNDLVVENIPAGEHSLALLAEANVNTDQNDLVSVTILEFPA